MKRASGRSSDLGSPHWGTIHAHTHTHTHTHTHAHTHPPTHCFKCGEVHSGGWGGLIDCLSQGASVVVNGAHDPVWFTALPSGSSHQETVGSTLNPTLWIVQLFSLFLNLFLMFCFSSNPIYDDLKTIICVYVRVCIYKYMHAAIKPTTVKNDEAVIIPLVSSPSSLSWGFLRPS